MNHGFIKTAAVTPPVKVADCEYNAAQIIACSKQAAAQNIALLVTPELGITGYTCADLFLQRPLQQAALQGLQTICAQTKGLNLILLVGLPLHHSGKLYNCAAVVHKGSVLGFVPKTHLPNYAEFYELRQFTPAFNGVQTYASSNGIFNDIPFGTSLLFSCKGNQLFTFAVEICEDLWVPAPPSQHHALAGATVVANLSASNEIIGKEEYRQSLVSGQSARLCCAYLYANAGMGESTTDMVFAGHNIIAENGIILTETKPFAEGMAVVEIDLERLAHERTRQNSFPSAQAARYQTIEFELEVAPEPQLMRPVSPHPFIPVEANALQNHCEKTLALQAAGLQKRLQHVGAKRLILGLSGGLDSTLALLVCLRALQAAGRPTADILAVTMPAFGTTARTRTNAEKLAEATGATLQTIDISASVRSHFADINHPEDDYSVVYENAQARMRTIVLMDLANQQNGLVVGTGDLSELALGWATYGGDHISMYGVNAGVPKTLVRHLVAHEANTKPELTAILQDVLDTPVSPELLPAVNGEISQQTEDLVGPYELHDFTLYYVLRWGFSPAKILFLAQQAFNGKYNKATILQWLNVFYKRFFAQQFKRSCLPDGPKVGSVGLSPRGDLRMPSDASAALWLKELTNL
ncbi:NAD(+) synthase [Ruminococcaceae bacterium OttesenSCG-928-A16]|nr:NAD(+) synthase [Ruminococcaceae bacterium OttesenSCG-928-A16]